MPEPINLSFYTEISKPSAAVAAGVTTVNGTGVSMAGYEGVMFIVVLGDVTATSVLTLKAQTCTDSGGTGAADITGATIAAAAAGATDTDDKVLILDVKAASGSFIRPVLTRATANAVVECILAIRYGYKKPPVAQAISVGTKVFAAA